MFLIAKFADAETRDALGYSAARVRSLNNRYGDFIQLQRVHRARAELKVAGKVIKTTGEGVRDIRKAADHEMRRFALKEKASRRPSTPSPQHTLAPRTGPARASLSTTMLLCVAAFD